MEAPGSARFACDFCRQKKLKCSRELPKCSTCKPWPSSCVYSRESSSSTTKGVGAISSHTATEVSIESRLDSLERTVQFLANSIDEALTAFSASQQRNFNERSHEKSTSEENASDSQLYIGPSHSFSFLREAPVGIQHVNRQGLEERVISEIRDMSSSLSTAPARYSMENSTPSFHVPSRAVGYKLLGRFLEQAELGQPFFRFPSDEILRDVIFEPHKVKEKGWIVSFNYILLATVSTELDEYEDKLRKNARLALNDSRIFLEPCIANVQALTLLSVHGEDFAAPNVSWMLLSQACRQAEALGLHVEASNATLSDDSQHRLCLFWMLFTLDKSCALAFGRPAFLPISLYRHVPLPDEQYMLKFCPHNTNPQQNKGSTFGALLFQNTVEFAKMVGDVLDLLTVGHSEEARDAMRIKLDTWFSNANMVLTQAMNDERILSDTKKTREMNLGICNIKFQYLHVLNILLKTGRTSNLRLSCAREAISLLPHLVSNWTSVYNGVIWQLLYYPFVPFFVIFENIVHQFGPYPTLEQDLRLLNTSVTYFAQMRTQMRLLAGVCSKLQHTATVFLRLAQSHINHNHTNSAEPAAEDDTYQQPNGPGMDEHVAQPWDDLTGTDLGNFNMMNYLDCLPADMDVTSRILEAEIHASNLHHLGRRKDDNPTYFHGPTPDHVFDWFLWDDYYGAIDISNFYG